MDIRKINEELDKLLKDDVLKTIADNKEILLMDISYDVYTKLLKSLKLPYGIALMEDSTIPAMLIGMFREDMKKDVPMYDDFVYAGDDDEFIGVDITDYLSFTDNFINKVLTQGIDNVEIELDDLYFTGKQKLEDLYKKASGVKY